jgi:hypothetical protein
MGGDMQMGNQTLSRFLSANAKPNQGSYQLQQAYTSQKSLI